MVKKIKVVEIENVETPETVKTPEPPPTSDPIADEQKYKMQHQRNQQ